MIFLFGSTADAVTPIGSSTGGPLRFEWETKDGIIYKYGSTVNSHFENSGAFFVFYSLFHEGNWIKINSQKKQLLILHFYIDYC
ncbi:MAG: hypothetical protein AAFV25_17670, partial [Bacteroidota bacterium]